MKKILLSLLAVFVATTSFAYEVGDYIYTQSAKFKVIGDNLVPALSAWDGASNVDVWSVYTGEDATANCLQSLDGGESAVALTKSVQMTFGSTYVVTLKVKGVSDILSSITDNGQNQIDAWVTTEDAYGTKTGTAGTDYIQVAAQYTVLGGEWNEVSFSYTAAELLSEVEATVLNIKFGRLTTESVIADVEVREVTSVYDTRIFDRKAEYASQILAEPAFNTDEAAEAKAQVEEIIAGYAEMGEVIDDAATMTEYEGLLDESLEEFMNASTTDMASSLSGITFTSMAKYNLGSTSTMNTAYSALTLTGGRWGHMSASDTYLRAGYQPGYTLEEHSCKFVNSNFPAGKYFITAEVRVANCVGNAWTYNYNLAVDSVVMTIGSQAYQLPTISGEDFQKFYFIADIQEGEEFSAGVVFPALATNKGGAVFIQNVQIRAWNEVATQIIRNSTIDTFLAQWNALVNARNAIASELNSPSGSYPWSRDSLVRAMDPDINVNAYNGYNPIEVFNKVLSNGWVTNGGSTAATREDIAGADVVANEELTDWAASNMEGMSAVRCLQYAFNYVKAQNAIITDLANAITAGESVRDDAMNINGDKATFQAALLAAYEVLKDVKANSTDEKKVTAWNEDGTPAAGDSVRCAQAIETLAAAVEAFQKSAEVAPFVDIDFENGFTPIYAVDDETGEVDESSISNYKVVGKKGEMVFTTASAVETDNTINSSVVYELGYNGALEGVLRVGATAATVEFGEDNLPTDNDIIRIEFDAYLGNLSGRYFTVQAQNADGVRLGGFSINRYNSTVAYNDFNNQTGAPNDLTSSDKSGGDGLDIRAYMSGIGSSSASNAAICVDANKSSMTLLFDYGAKTLQGTIVNGKNGTCEGAAMPMLDVNDETITDNKVAKFVISSNYNNADRRCWFDNLKIYKYASASGSADAITKVQSDATSTIKGVYSITGQKVSETFSNLPRGIYIYNGKKYLVK